MSKVYVGDTGTLIDLDTGVSLVGATVLEIKARKPDGTVVTWTATASTTHLQYTTLNNTLDQHGIWKLQASVTLPSGKWTGETADLKVHAPYA
jgi:hypothetical protein